MMQENGKDCTSSAWNAGLITQVGRIVWFRTRESQSVHTVVRISISTTLGARNFKIMYLFKNLLPRHAS